MGNGCQLTLLYQMADHKCSLLSLDAISDMLTYILVPYVAD